MVEASEVSPALRLALAQRYGTTTVSIWLRPGATPGHVTRSRAQTALPACPTNPSTGKPFDCRSRDGYDDDYWINGGSVYSTSDSHACSTGFGWKIGTKKYILTAGHCNPTDVSNKKTSIGDVVGSTFNSKTGTIIRTGQTKPYGDLSLIDPSTSSSLLSSTASIFTHRGIEGATAQDPPGWTKREVYGRYTQRAKGGDRYCTGGAYYGEICGYVVQFTHKRVPLQDEETGAKFFVNPITEGSKITPCSDHGDSGGPVYTIINGAPSQGGSGVIAKGIISGSLKTVDCKQWFTDLFDAKATFGGDILKRKLP